MLKKAVNTLTLKDRGLLLLLPTTEAMCMRQRDRIRLVLIAGQTVTGTNEVVCFLLHGVFLEN